MKSILSFRPNINVHFFDHDKLILFSEESHILFKSKIYVELAKLIEEERYAATDLVQLLSHEFSKDMLEKALTRLTDGFLEEKYVTKHNDASRSFWYENGVDPFELQNFQTSTKISIIYFGIKKDENHSSFFKELGFEICDDGDFTLIITNSYLREDLRDLLILNNGPILLCKPSGRNVWLGPIILNDSLCWDCVVHSLKENLRVEVDIYGSHNSSLGFLGRSHLSASMHLALNLCAVQIAFFLVNRRSSLEKNIINLDSINFEFRKNQLGLIFCDKCQLFKTNALSKPYKLKSSFIFNNSWRAHPLDITLDKLEKIVSPITGIVPKYVLYEVNNDYVFSSIRNLPILKKTMQSPSSLRIPDASVGKGNTKNLAKVGCLAESLERYNNSYFNTNNSLFCSFESIKENAILPKNLMLFSENQYTHREEINKKECSFNKVPIPYDGSNIHWTKAYSIDNQNYMYIPSSFCYLNYPHQNEIDICPGDTNGCASGNSLEEAIFYGLLEVVERDALAIWWYNRLQMPSLNLSNLKNSIVQSQKKSHADKGRELVIIDITLDLKIPTYVAVSFDSEGNRIYFGSSAHFDPEIAIQNAIHELNQMMTREIKEFGQSAVHECERKLVSWLREENIKNHKYLNPSTKIDFNRFEYAQFISSDFKEYILYFGNLLNEMKMNAYWINQSYVNIDFYTVKVVVPGLRHFWNRLAPGRLFEVPVKLKKLTHSNSEFEMNPISYFL